MPHVVMLKCGDHFLTQYIEVFEWYSPDQVFHNYFTIWHAQKY